MILRFLGARTLQEAVGSQLLERLERLGPALLPDEGDPTELYKRSNLLKILAAFAPAKLMKSEEFRRTLIDAVDAQTLEVLLTATKTKASGAEFQDGVNALVGRGWGNPDFCRAFVEAAGLPETFLPPRVRPSDDVERVAAPESPFKTLKDYQHSVFNTTKQLLRPERARLVVQMPTGSGKTRTAMEVVCNVLNNAGEGGIVAWVAHAEELCEQAISCFRQVWEHIGRRPARIVRLFGSHSTIITPTDGSTLVVAGFQKLHSLTKRRSVELSTLAPKVQLIVIDEAHKVIARTFKEAAQSLKGPETRIIGLTATPGRSAGDSAENAALASFFFGKIAEIQAPDGMNVLQFLRGHRVLSRARMETLRTARSYELTKVQLRALERDLDYPSGFLSSLGADDVRNVEIVRRLEALCKEDRQILFFACSVDHSRFICALLVYLGVKATHVDGTTQAQERMAAIEDFRSGEVQVLCNYGILSTGFDAPKTDVVFVARPTTSVVLYSQMIGRGLRGPAIGGTAECLIVNVIDNIIGLPANEDIYDYFQDYWQQEG
jgi:DNA repair protein RadD